MRDTDTQTVKNGWKFPVGVPVPADHYWFRFSIGDTEVWGFDWNAHVEIVRRSDWEMKKLRTNIRNAGVEEGLTFAAVEVELEVHDPQDERQVFSCAHAADSASNQVRNPDMAVSVAESRATKRVVKKALGIVPADEETSKANDETATSTDPSGSGGSVDVDDDGEVHIDPPDGIGTGSNIGTDDVDW